ncbi:MAG: amino acid ABC transporter ATP-binding protein [Phycisphaerae bacterium]
MIAVRNLVKRFAGMAVLADVSLEVRRGETAALIGGSGSGKSTLLRCINALETFDDGQVHVGDVALGPGEARSRDETARRRLRRRVGMVFQQFNLFPHMTALQNVMCGPVFALGEPRERAAERARGLLKRVGLGDRLDHRPAMLSGGQQQRVAIARALAVEPEAILFDEPTSALDPRMTVEVLSVIADLAADGLTMLIVSHAMEFVRRAAQTVHVLSAGRVVESGPPQRIFEAAEHAATRDLLASAKLAG